MLPRMVWKLIASVGGRNVPFWHPQMNSYAALGTGYAGKGHSQEGRHLSSCIQLVMSNSADPLVARTRYRKRTALHWHQI